MLDERWEIGEMVDERYETNREEKKREEQVAFHVPLSATSTCGDAGQERADARLELLSRYLYLDELLDCCSGVKWWCEVVVVVV